MLDGYTTLEICVVGVSPFITGLAKLVYTFFFLFFFFVVILNEENRRRIASWTIMLACVGAFVLTSAASTIGLPRWVILLFFSQVILTCIS